ncbi:MAG: AAA family ATPase, partial [Nocardioidaceae bacterium]
MILHHLAIEAFGPFAGCEEVDFDLLSGSGLFLLCGETGAGKTSVLDAVCFALFGQVPGDRDKAKRLRSDHAAPGHGPRVVLETTVRGRRLRITRSPEWVRPKKRGNGTVREHAKALVEERIDGEWQQRTSRMDEAGDLVGSMLGMTMSQFCQVAMLPQGRFETFLRAGAQERHTLLEKLFGTHRFRAVEEWLTEHRRRLVRESDRHADRIAGLLERIGEVGGCTRPDELSPDGLLAWSDAIRKETLARLADATEARSAADQSAKDVQVALESARAVADLQARHRDAQRQDADLRALADSTRALETQIRDARRAEVLRPIVQLADAAVARVGRTREAMVESRHPLPTIHPADDPDHDGREHVTGLVRCEREKVAQLEALLPVDTQVTDLDAEVGRLGHELDEAAGAHHRAEILADETEPRLVRTREAHLDAVTSARRVDPLQEQVTRAERILDMTRRLPELEQRRESLRGAHGEAVDAAHQARADWLDLRQARLEGMAAE